MKYLLLLAIASPTLSSSAVPAISVIGADQGRNYSLIVEFSKTARLGMSPYHTSATASLCCKICTVGKACGDT